jgi:hypothetical protein
VKAPFRPVIVHWEDAALHTSEYQVDRAKTLPLSERLTIGWLLNRNEDVVRLAHTFDPTDGVSDVFVIPAGWVKKIEKL